MKFNLYLVNTSLIIATFYCIFFVSCKKISEKKEKTKVEIINPKLIEDFFKTAESENKEIIKIADNWSKQAGFKSQLPAFIAKNGYPLWDKAVYNFAGESTKKLSTKVNSESSGISFIPLRDAQSSQIKSYVVCNKHSDSVYSYRLYNKSELLQNILKGNDSLKYASNLTLSLFAYFEKQVNGNESMSINDGFGEKTISVTNFTVNTSQNNVAGRVSSYFCGRIYTIRWVTTETVNGQTVFQAHSIEVAVFCANLISGWDPSQVGTPTSEIDGGGGGIYYYTPGSLGGGGNSGTGWWQYANGYNGVYLEGNWYSYQNLYPYWASYPVSTVLSEEDFILQNLTTTLGLNQTQFNTLKANLNMVSALQNYLANSPEEPVRKIEIIKEHIDLMVANNEYLVFCQTYTLNANSLAVWWENDLWLSNPNNFNLDIDYNGQQYDELTSEEKKLVALYPKQAYIIKENVNEALVRAIQLYPSQPGLHPGLNDKADAFRHAYFQAMNTRDITPNGIQITTAFANAHESEVPPQLQKEKEMDLHNNAIGIQVADNQTLNGAFTSNEQFQILIQAKISDGSLRYLAPLNHSDPNWYVGQIDGKKSSATNGIIASTQLIPSNQ